MIDKEKLKKFKEQLRKMFRSDEPDFNWGVYRIIKQKNQDVDDFIENEIPNIIKDNLKVLYAKSVESLEKELDEIKSDCQKLGVDYETNERHKEKLKEKKELTEIGDIESQIYNDLLEFFSRYFIDGDFISKFYYKNDQYMVPYDGSETYLHWATKDQYYIKTSDVYNRLSINAGKFNIIFRVVQADQEKGNVKAKGDKFFVLDKNAFELNKDTNEFFVNLNNIVGDDEIKEKGKNKSEIQEKLNEEILNELKNELEKNNIKCNEDFEKVLKTFQKRYTKDFFIHKNLKEFLSGELKTYVKNEIFDLDKVIDIEIKINKELIVQSQTLKKIADKIIERLASIEDLKRKVWEKKKFIFDTGYCMTLDYINKKYYKDVLKNKKQIAEWVSLGFIKESMLNEKYLEENPTLVIDTAFFDIDFKYKILSEIDDLDEKINGILINSENFQALNLLLNKYKEKIKCCYIDPPYNTGNDGFLYKDGFNHSSWLSLMNDRLILTKELLNNNGVFFSSINDIELKNLNKIADSIFGNENFIVNLVWENKEGGGSSDSRFFRIKHEYVTSYSKNTNTLKLDGDIKEEDEAYNYNDRFVKERGKYKLIKLNSFSIRSSPSLQYEIELPNGEKITPHEGGKKGCWRWNEDQFKWGLKNEFIEFKKNAEGKLWVYTKQYFKVDHKGNEIIRSVPYRAVISKFSSTQATKQLEKLFGDKPFAYSKPTDYIKFLLNLSINQKLNDNFLDFFAGSGTTGHAVLKLNKEDRGNRKFILVEMGQYFDTVLKPRILKVIFSDNWKEGKPLDNKGSEKQIIKYQTLEQYEDSLENIQFKQTDLRGLDKVDKETLFKYDFNEVPKKSKTFLGADIEKNWRDFSILTLDKNLKANPIKVDLIETFNYLIGMWIDKYQIKEDKQREYIVIKGKIKDKPSIIIWRDNKNLIPEKDKKFIEEEIIEGEKVENIFVNSDCMIKGAKHIFNEMRKRL
ncbi:MAG: site-specific DNA-methyltransferase [Candidatus Woesearchaeota archaeon]